MGPLLSEGLLVFRLSLLSGFISGHKFLTLFFASRYFQETYGIRFGNLTCGGAHFKKEFGMALEVTL